MWSRWRNLWRNQLLASLLTHQIKKMDGSRVLKRSKSGITIDCRTNKKKAQLRKSGAKSVVNSLKKPLDNNIMAKNSSLTVRLISMGPIM